MLQVLQLMEFTYGYFVTGIGESNHRIQSLCFSILRFSTKDPIEVAKYDVVLTTYAIVAMEVPKQPLVEQEDEDHDWKSKPELEIGSKSKPVRVLCPRRRSSLGGNRKWNRSCH